MRSIASSSISTQLASTVRKPPCRGAAAPQASRGVQKKAMRSIVPRPSPPNSRLPSESPPVGGCDVEGVAGGSEEGASRSDVPLLYPSLSFAATVREGLEMIHEDHFSQDALAFNL